MDELIALERAGWDSPCDGTGGEFYGRVMTADGVMILANGGVMTPDEAVADSVSRRRGRRTRSTTCAPCRSVRMRLPCSTSVSGIAVVTSRPSWA